jgi:hypothetical protein
MSRDLATPNWVQHIALRTSSHVEMMKIKENLENDHHNVIGPIYHGVFDSIYFFNPNGHRLEVAVDTKKQVNGVDAYTLLKKQAEPMLKEWSETRMPPQHVAWLHQD